MQFAGLALAASDRLPDGGDRRWLIGVGEGQNTVEFAVGANRQHRHAAIGDDPVDGVDLIVAIAIDLVLIALLAPREIPTDGGGIDPEGRRVVELGFYGGSALLDHFQVVLTGGNHALEGAGEGQGFHRSPPTRTPALSSTTKAVGSGKPRRRISWRATSPTAARPSSARANSSKVDLPAPAGARTKRCGFHFRAPPSMSQNSPPLNMPTPQISSRTE